MRNSQQLQALREEEADILQEIRFLKQAFKESEGPERDLQERIETLEIFLTEIFRKIEELQ